MLTNRGHHDLGEGHSFDWQVITPCAGHDPDDDDSCSIVSPHTHDQIILSGERADPVEGEQIFGVTIFHPAPPDSGCIPQVFGVVPDDEAEKGMRAEFEPSDPTQSGRAYLEFANIERLDGRPNNSGGHTIEVIDPLTIGPTSGTHSILCTACGDHGWVHDGRWLTEL